MRTRTGFAVIALLAALAPAASASARQAAAPPALPPTFDPESLVRAADARGRLHVLAVARDRSVWRFQEPPDGGAWRVDRLGGQAAGAPAVTLTGHGRLQVWTTGPDGSLWMNVEQGGGEDWVGWTRVKAPPAASVAAAPWRDGRTALVVAGPDGRLHSGSADGAGETAEWQALPLAAAAAPRLLQGASGGLEVLVAGRDGALYTAALPGLRPARIPAPAVRGRVAVAELPDRIVLVGSTAEGLVSLQRTGGGWAARTIEATSGFSEPELAVLDAQTLALVARGPGGTMQATWLRDGKAGDWLDTQIESRPGATAWSGSRARLALLSARLLDNLAAGLAEYKLPGFRLSINTVLPNPIVEGDAVRVHYTLANETGEDGVGSVKAVFDGKAMEPAGTPFSAPLAGGQSFTGMFTTGPGQTTAPGTRHLQLLYAAGTEKVLEFPPALGLAPVVVHDYTQFAEARASAQVLGFGDRFPTDDPPVPPGPVSCLDTTPEQQHGCGWNVCGAGNTPATCPQDCPAIAAARRSYNALDLCRGADGPLLVPRSIADMQEAIATASGLGARVRLVGSFHTSNPLPCTEGRMISTAALTGAAPALPGGGGTYCERFDCTARLDQAQPVIESFHGVTTVRVGPGYNVFELAEFLDRNGLSLGFAFPGFRAATIGGAVATGTHGSSPLHPAVLSTRVKSLAIVGADGEVRELSGQTLPAATWEAARVGLGYLGAIVQLRLYVEPAFNLRVTTRWAEAADLLAPGAPHSLVAGCDWGEMVWFPAQGSDDAPVMILCGRKTTDSGNSHNTLLFPADSDNAARADAAIDLMQFEACRGIQSCRMERTRADVLRYNKPPYTGTDCMAGAVKVGLHVPPELLTFDDVAQMTAGMVFTAALLASADALGDCEADAVGKGHHMMSSRLTPARTRPLERDWEVFVPAEQAAAALQMAKSYFQQHSICLPLIGVFIRFAPAEHGTLIAHTVKEGPLAPAPAAAGMFFEIPVFMPKGMTCVDQARYEKLYADLVERLVLPPINARAHWGKNRRSLFQLQRRIGAYGQNMRHFRDEVKKADPTGVFANQFGVDMGLRWPLMASPVPPDAQSPGCAR